jgi:transposase, IS30 family
MASDSRKPKRYKHLTQDDRAKISVLRQQDLSIRQIATALHRSPSTISREVRRNRCHDGFYRVAKAQKRARGRMHISRRNLRLTPAIMAVIRDRLISYWSPEQIARTELVAGRPIMCHESIYRIIGIDRRSGGTLWQYLRCGQKHRRKRYGTYDNRGRLPGKRMIGQRPDDINSRQTFGHWEGDTVVGPGGHCILTLVERKSRFTIIGKLIAKTTQEVNAVAARLLRPYQRLVKTITFDNGTEFNGYKDLEAALGIVVYFANPHHSWERGTNENMNGLIRQFIPKRTTMFSLSQFMCHAYARMLNDRPRKVLGFETPSKRLRQMLGVAV